MSTSLRIPPEIKKRLQKVAKNGETTPHAFMIEAIEEKLRAVELHSAFVSEAENRLAEMKAQGVGIPADEVFEHLRQRAAGRPSRRPKPRAIR